MCIVKRPFCIEIAPILSQELRDQLFRVLNPGHELNTLSQTSFKSSSKRPFGVLLRSAAKSGKKREKKRETD
jgi:hypothetical protein